MNNGIFGKSITNNCKMIDVQGAFTQELCQKKLSSPLLEYFESINESFAVFKMKRKKNFIYYQRFSGVRLSGSREATYVTFMYIIHIPYSNQNQGKLGCLKIKHVLQ